MNVQFSGHDEWKVACQYTGCMKRTLDLLTCHPVAMAGTALVTLAGISWLFLLPIQISGHANNPYLGLMAFLAIPTLFFLGLALIPIGAALARRHPAVAMRRTGVFFVAMTAVNLLIGSQVTYRAVAHMETVQFCGQSCHVMAPQLAAHARSSHESVQCAECHITPGASGWFKAKTAGTRQLAEVLLGNYARPVPSAIETGRLAPSSETCEKCHSRASRNGLKVDVKVKYSDDEKNTRTQTILSFASGSIHRTHLGRITYAAKEASRQTIPWVEWRADGGTKVFTSGEQGNFPKHEMQCADCHNRSGHDFPSVEGAVDQALESGEVPVSQPFIKRDLVKLLQGPSDKWTPQAARIASTHLYPDLKVGWGAYTNNLGHDGCNRCHDGDHADAAKTAIPNDCMTCHQVLAVDEASPEIATTLGIKK